MRRKWANDHLADGLTLLLTDLQSQGYGEHVICQQLASIIEACQKVTTGAEYDTQLASILKQMDSLRRVLPPAIASTVNERLRQIARQSFKVPDNRKN